MGAMHSTELLLVLWLDVLFRPAIPLRSLFLRMGVRVQGTDCPHTRKEGQLPSIVGQPVGESVGGLWGRPQRAENVSGGMRLETSTWVGERPGEGGVGDWVAGGALRYSPPPPVS